MSYGVTSDGFVAKTLEIIQAELTTAFESAFGIVVAAAPVATELIGILAEREALLWELAEAAYNAYDPDGATGAALDAVCALTGTVREAATESTVTGTLTGDPATVVASGSVASVDPAGDMFETTAAATIAALTAWAINTVYVVGDRRTNAARAYVCITAGTSAGAGGPTTTAADITDNTAHWRYMGEGTAAVDVAMEAQETGLVAAASGTLTTIETPVAGWSSVRNLLDADVGTVEETDEELRVRREVELVAPGTGTIDAVRTDLLDVADVTSVTLFVNNTDITDGDGVPPHAVEALVLGGADQDIWDQLLASVPIGIATHGTEAGTAEDSQGTSHAMEFSRPDEIEIYIAITVTYDADLYPADGDAQIEAAIVAWGDAQSCGKDAVAAAIRAQAFSVPGVLDITDFDVDDVTPPVGGDTTVAITTRQLAVYDTSRITVTSGAATP